MSWPLEIVLPWIDFLRVYAQQWGCCFIWCYSVDKLCPTLCYHMDCSTPGFLVFHYLPEFTQTHVHWVYDTIQPCHLLSPPFLVLPSIFYSFRVFSIRWPKYWSFDFSINSSNEYSDLISFNWLVWSPCCSRDSWESSPTPQFKSINSLAFSLLYGPTLTSVHDYWKNYSFDYTDFVGKVMSLLFNTLPIRKLEENHRFSSIACYSSTFNLSLEMSSLEKVLCKP